jgi:transposase
MVSVFVCKVCNPYDARKLSPQEQEALRKRVADAVCEQGMPPAEAAQTFNYSRTAIYHIRNQYRAGGEKALAAKKRGRPRETPLKGHQAATLVNLITDNCPDQLKLGFALWTRAAVQERGTTRFNKHRSVWRLGRWLRQWNLTPQKPLKKAYEQAPQAVQQWLNEDYPAIRRKARRERGEIHWGDQMGMRSDHQTAPRTGAKERHRGSRAPANVSPAT